MQQSETGRPGPETERTMLEIENEWRAKVGLPLATSKTTERAEGFTVTTIVCGPQAPRFSPMEAGLFLDLRQKWAALPPEVH